MPRPKKGPRLWYRPERIDPRTGGRIATGQYLILDGTKQIATGCVHGEEAAADEQLAKYNVARFQPARRLRDIEQIDVAEVLAIYDADTRDRQANQRTFDARMLRLADWWGGKVLADINGQTCREYAAWCRSAGPRKNTEGGARRDLEDLRAALNYHAKQGLHHGVVGIVLPPRGLPRDRWLTRSEAAKLVWACWRYREQQKRHRGADAGKVLPTKKRPLQHVARFILLALYTGTRAGAVASASPYRREGHSWVDLDAGLFYRLAEGKRATKKRQPPVRLPDHLLAHLRRWKRTAIATSHFVEFDGAPVQSVKVGFAHGVELAGLEGKVTPHTLRHTAATWLMINGTELWQAAGFLGMSADLLERVYGHHHPDFQAEAAAGFRGKRLSNETPKKPQNKRGTDANKAAPDLLENPDDTST